MDVLYERCCGLDVHKKLVVVCMITPGPKGKPRKEVRSFGTMTADLLVLSDWLEEQGATHIAMESPAWCDEKSRSRSGPGGLE